MSGLPRLLVISPHLDDAVFGCGEFMARLPGAVCVTVFAGLPSDPTVLTEWDRAAGHGSALEALAVRRGEDAAALRHLNAHAHWFAFTDDQYGEQTPRTCADISAMLDHALALYRPDAVAMPFGLYHRDHALVHEAALACMARHPALDWYGYEDALYRCIPGLLQSRLQTLVGRGVRATACSRLPSEADSPKRRAVRSYGSQLRALSRPGGPGHADVLAPEGCWRLAAA